MRILRRPTTGRWPKTNDMRLMLDGRFYEVLHWEISGAICIARLVSLADESRAISELSWRLGCRKLIRILWFMRMRETKVRRPGSTAVSVDTGCVKTWEEGGFAATMKPRRSRDANAISGSIPAADCLRSSRPRSENNEIFDMRDILAKILYISWINGAIITSMPSALGCCI